MKSVQKKLILSVIIVIILSLGFYLIWKKIAGTQEGDDFLPANGFPENPLDGGDVTKTSAGPTLKRLSDQEVTDFWLVEETGEIYYINYSGNILIAKDGPDLEVSKQNVSAINSSETSPSTRKILVAFSDPLSPQWGIFDIFDKVWRPLPSEILVASWGASDDKLVALVKNSGKTDLVEVDLTKTPPANKILLGDFGFKDIRLIFNPPDKILIVEKTSADYQGRLWQFNILTQNLNLMISGEKGLSLYASPQKDFFLKYSSDNGLDILTPELAPTMESPLNTLPQKCGFGEGAAIYCFEPIVWPPDAELPDDYLVGKIYTVDDLFEIDPLGEGRYSRVFRSGENNLQLVDGEKPTLAGGNVYFVNRFDNRLYSVTLP
ncbi:MAG TPA: hypothetical protein VNK70_02090 [Candidatus Paceibacterota bacterium]|nr:hypothetical protein [Candidatus Paceibacterota bacterium]